MVRWIPNKIADSCVCDTTRKRRSTRDQHEAQEMLDYIDSVPWIEHFSSEIVRGVSQHDALSTILYGVILSVACMQHSEKTLRSALSVLFVNSITLIYTSPSSGLRLPQERVARDPHVKSEFEKESNSGTSVAFDPARGDPCNVHLIARAPEMILYI
jgi:hypothetical protein